MAWKLVDIVNLISKSRYFYEVPLTLAEHDSDIKVKACTKHPQSFVTRFCAYNLLSYQVSVYRTIGPLVFPQNLLIDGTCTLKAVIDLCFEQK